MPAPTPPSSAATGADATRRSWAVLARATGAALAAALLVLGATDVSGAVSGRTPADGPARASGLPWSSGVFSHDAARTTGFEHARGRPVDVLAVFPTRDTWAAVADPWWMSSSAVPAGFTGTLNVGLPLFPTDGTLERAASGEYDEQWRRLGTLIASRYPDAWVRPGWEMNIPDWPWSANPGNVELYKQAFRRAATGLRAGGPGLRIVFNPNEGAGGSLPDARVAYPGDGYVDDIGIDAYDWYPSYTAGGWDAHRTKDQGWDFWAEFARAHGKTFSVPEWGVMSGSPASGGDNPEYVTAVLTWMREHRDLMSFDTYFEEPEDYCRCALSLNPSAQLAYTAMMPALADTAGSAPTTAPTPSAEDAAPTQPPPGGPTGGPEAPPGRNPADDGAQPPRRGIVAVLLPWAPRWLP